MTAERRERSTALPTDRWYGLRHDSQVEIMILPLWQRLAISMGRARVLSSALQPPDRLAL